MGSSRSHSFVRIARTTPLLIVLLLWLVLSGFIVAIQPAQAVPVNVTVTITRVIELQCPDSAAFTESCPGDYFAKVKIGNSDFQQSPRIDGNIRCDAAFCGVIGSDYEIFPNPFWTFTATVDSSLGTVPVVIQLLDHDGILGSPLVDTNPARGKSQLDLMFNLNTKSWSGDVPNNVGFSSGPFSRHDDAGSARIFFDVSVGNGDIDGDGIPDGVERFGVRDKNGNIIQNTGGFGFPMDPCRKTVAVEIDYMIASASHTHQPLTSVMNRIVNIFGSAPVDAVSVSDCPYPGFPTQNRGVNLVIDVDDPIRHVQYLDLGPDFERVKNISFDLSRKPYFHYNLWVHNISPTDPSLGGRGESPGNDFIVRTGNGAPPNRALAIFMHELGHNLGLGHGGNETVNCKPNYISVMNYVFTDGIRSGTPLVPRFDYSHEALGPLNEAALSESAGIGDGDDFTWWGPPKSGSTPTSPLILPGGRGNGPLNWDWDKPAIIDDMPGTPDPSSVRVDINMVAPIIRDCPSSPDGILRGFDDWANLDYIFRDDSDYQSGVHHAAAEPDFTFEMMDRLEAAKESFFSIPPETAIDSAADGQGNPIQDGDYTQSTEIFFQFSSPDVDLTGFECKLDGSDWVPCLSGEGGGVIEGEHTFQVRAIDATGNTDPTPAMFSWMVIEGNHPPPPPPTPIFSDGFDGTSASPENWNSFVAGPGPKVVQNDALLISIPSDSTEAAGEPAFGAGYQSSAWLLRGDFDIQVDFDISEADGGTGIRQGLLVTSDPLAGNGISRVSFGNSDFPGSPREAYAMEVASGTQGVTEASQSQGSLRLIRNGSALSGYYLDDESGQWVLVHSGQSTFGDGDVHVSLAAWSHDEVFVDQDAQVAFDNFIINTGLRAEQPLPP